MVTQLQARLHAVWDAKGALPPMTPDKLVMLLDKFSIKKKSTQPMPRAPKANPVDLMPPGTHEGNLKN